MWNSREVVQILTLCTLVLLPSVAVVSFHDLSLVNLGAVGRNHALDATSTGDRAREVLLRDVDLVIKAAGIGLAT